MSSSTSVSRDILEKVRKEFQSAVVALERQVSTLTSHNELLTNAYDRQQKLIENLEKQHEWDQEDLHSLQETLQMTQEDMDASRHQSQTQRQAQEHQITQLKQDLVQTTARFKRWELNKADEVHLLTQQLAQAQAYALQQTQRAESYEQRIQLSQSAYEEVKREAERWRTQAETPSPPSQQTNTDYEYELTRLKRKMKEMKEENAFLKQAIVDRSSHDRKERRHRHRSRSRKQAKPKEERWENVETKSDGVKTMEESSLVLTDATEPPEWTPPTTPEKSIRPRPSSVRLERELSGLRHKLDACLHLDES